MAMAIRAIGATVVLSASSACTFSGPSYANNGTTNAREIAAMLTEG